MEITGTRIGTLNRRADHIPLGTSIIIGVIIDPSMRAALVSIGFEKSLNVGDSVLPLPIGTRTTFNAEGEWEIHKDQPMETAYTQSLWEWKHYDGTPDSRIVTRSYQRYPRTRIPPPGIELQITTTADGQRVLVSPTIVYQGSDDKNAIHIVNLFLEIVGRCEIFTEDLAQIIRVPIRRLNWTILPPGRRPWAKLKPLVEEAVKTAPEGNQVVILDRFEAINSYGPDVVNVGRAGFAGYVVFGFEQQNVFVFESIYSGNATYLFGDDWESLSQYTKTQVLDENLHDGRVVHLENWADMLAHELAVKGISK